MDKAGDGIIPLAEYKKYFSDFYLYDCVVRNENFFYFLAKEDSLNGASKLITCRQDKPEKPLGQIVFNGWGTLTLGYSPQETKCIVGSRSRKVFSIGGGESHTEAEIPYDRSGQTGCRGGLTKFKEIDGKLYVCGAYRNIGIRRGVEDWLWQSAQIPLSQEEKDGSANQVGFTDMDGFSASDIYAAGNFGDALHFDGQSWQKVMLPWKEGELISAVCCAGDGNVYMACNGTALYVGRTDTWQRIRIKPHVLINDIVWYDNRVWLSGKQVDEGVWWLENGRLVPAGIPAPLVRYGGALSVRNGVLLLASERGIAYHKDGQWTHLLDFYTMAAQLRESESK